MWVLPYVSSSNAYHGSADALQKSRLLRVHNFKRLQQINNSKLALLCFKRTWLTTSPVAHFEHVLVAQVQACPGSCESTTSMVLLKLLLLCVYFAFTLRLPCVYLAFVLCKRSFDPPMTRFTAKIYWSEVLNWPPDGLAPAWPIWATCYTWSGCQQHQQGGLLLLSSRQPIKDGYAILGQLRANLSIGQNFKDEGVVIMTRVLWSRQWLA